MLLSCAKVHFSSLVTIISPRLVVSNISQFYNLLLPKVPPLSHGYHVIQMNFLTLATNSDDKALSYSFVYIYRDGIQ
jgi:hypothetical protein